MQQITVPSQCGGGEINYLHNWSTSRNLRNYRHNSTHSLRRSLVLSANSGPVSTMRTYTIAKGCDASFQLADGSIISAGFLNTVSKIRPTSQPYSYYRAEKGDIRIQFWTGSEINFVNPRGNEHDYDFPNYSIPKPELGFYQMIRVSGKVFGDLKATYGDGVKVKVKMDGLRLPEDEYISGARTTSDNSQVETGVMTFLGGETYEERVTLPKTWTSHVSGRYQNGLTRFVLSVTIQAIVGQEVPQRERAEPAVDNLSIVRRMLREEIEADAVLVSHCGTEIKCHKGFLSSHSSVLATMFQSGFKEATTAKVEMVDMTKKGICAFLGYLYCWEVAQAEQHSSIALQLFEAGHKYGIGSLEKATKRILLEKSNEWYNVNVALKLFLFSRNVDGCNDIKTKAVQVLKAKFNELQSSKEYQNLFEKDAKAAMELCALAFSA